MCFHPSKAIRIIADIKVRWNRDRCKVLVFIRATVVDVMPSAVRTNAAASKKLRTCSNHVLPRDWEMERSVQAKENPSFE